MKPSKTLLATLLDLVALLFAVWVMFGRPPLGPRAWHYLSRVAYATAAYAGAVGIAAEAQYYAAVRA